MHLDVTKNVINNNNQVTFVCPFCKVTRDIDITPFERQNKQTITLKCSCNNISEVAFNYRSFYRKPVSIIGLIDGNTSVIIEDLSIYGCKINALTKNNFGTIENLKRFTLNLSLMLKDITKVCEIVHINKKQLKIGVKFVDTNFTSDLYWFLKD